MGCRVPLPHQIVSSGLRQRSDIKGTQVREWAVHPTDSGPQVLWLPTSTACWGWESRTPRGITAHTSLASHSHCPSALPDLAPVPCSHGQPCCQRSPPNGQILTSSSVGHHPPQTLEGTQFCWPGVLLLILSPPWATRWTQTLSPVKKQWAGGLGRGRSGVATY